MSKGQKKIKGLNVFKHEFLYTAYADETTFFLKAIKTIIELMSELNAFSSFPGSKPNKTKCAIAGIGVLNGVQMALCGMKCVNIINETMKILDVYFSYNKNLEQDKNLLQTYCQKRKHFKIMPHETVNFRRKNYGLQILSCL